MIDRRGFLASGTLAALATQAAAAPRLDLDTIERARIPLGARAYLARAPRTITAIRAPRSVGTVNDYYSEADYWWPDPANATGPYIRRDGFSNPAKFDGHRDALIAFGIEMPALTSAWLLTADARYARHAVAHLRAWFVDPATRMTPNLLHAQAVVGVNSGRSIGIIDTVQIVEVARAADALRRTRAPGYDPVTRRAVEDWFRAYLDWLANSPPGKEERDQANNHGTCWLLQAASYATLLRDEAMLDKGRGLLANVIIPAQIAPDGSQPLELARTKPYSYSLFNLDMLASSCRLLSRGNDLWRFATPDNRSIGRAIAFMVPYIRDKRRWPHPADVEYFGNLPVRQPSLLFGGEAMDRPDWLMLWRSLDPDPTVHEIVRNFPVRQPLLWSTT